MDPKEALLAGEPLLSRVLTPHGSNFIWFVLAKGRADILLRRSIPEKIGEWSFTIAGTWGWSTT
jgi:hypothetical protein